MHKRNLARVFLLLAVVGLTMGSVAAGITVYDKDGKKVEVGGRIQLNYVNFSTDCPGSVDCLLDDSGVIGDGSYDRVFFRRLRPYIAGTITEHWKGKIEFDFGEAEDSDEIQVKDAYFARTGFANKASTLTIGNQKTAFAREFLTSSANLQLVEREFVGDHNFGVPDRALGVRWDSRVLGDKLAYAVTFGAEHHDPAVNRMDFDSPVNNASDWNEGFVVAGRVDYHFMGYEKFSQGNFGRGTSKVAVGVGAFTWNNDDDNNTYTDASGSSISTSKVDLDKADGVEVGVAYRGHGLSVDAAAQRVTGDTVDPTFTGGIYRDGTTELSKLSVVAGYLFSGELFEIVAGWDSQDADGYEEKWQRTTAGVNFYFNEHHLKLQLNYVMAKNFIGLEDQDNKTFFASTLFAF